MLIQATSILRQSPTKLFITYKIQLLLLINKQNLNEWIAYEKLYHAKATICTDEDSFVLQNQI